MKAALTILIIALASIAYGQDPALIGTDTTTVDAELKGKFVKITTIRYSSDTTYHKRVELIRRNKIADFVEKFRKYKMIIKALRNE